MSCLYFKDFTINIVTLFTLFIAIKKLGGEGNSSNIFIAAVAFTI